MEKHSHLRRQPLPLLLVILLDLLLAAGILAVYGLFQVLLPAMTAKPLAPAATPAPTVLTEAAPTLEPETPATPEPTPDTRTPWQIRFAEHFTDQIVRTDRSYSSPEISISLETNSVSLSDGRTAVYHVADVYVADIENFRTYTANNELKYFSVQDVMEMDQAAGAILSVSGDCYSYQPTGFLMRNGVSYKEDQTYCDLCVLYKDGRMETYARDEYRVADILAQDPWQIWNFGPSLLDAEGHVKDSYELSESVSYTNPRCAIGYYEPGHYCFVVVDGRQPGYSDGMLMWELAYIFEGLGCRCAYNLDGGGTAVMIFDHERYSQQSNGADRQIGDIVLIAERGA